MPSIAEQKSQLRRDISAARKGLDGLDGLNASTRHAETSACHQALFELPQFQSATSILLTMNFGYEMDTRAVIDKALLMGKRVALPRVDAATNTLHLYWFDARTKLETNAYGIDEPSLDAATAAIENISLVLVPGLAFDGAGNRLGYGRGYYDKLLANTHATKVAIAFNCQVVGSVPTEPHDAKVDTLITASQTKHFPQSTHST